jgi:hypothetical protein
MRPAWLRCAASIFAALEFACVVFFHAGLLARGLVALCSAAPAILWQWLVRQSCYIEQRPNVAAGQISVLIAQLQVRQEQTTVTRAYAIGAGASSLVAYPAIKQLFVEGALAVVAIARLMTLLDPILAVRRSIPADPAQ